MSLRARTLAFIGLTFMILLLVQVAMLHYTIGHDITAKQYSFAASELKRALVVMQVQQEELDSTTGAYGIWDDAYEFAQTLDPGFSAADLALSSYEAEHLNLQAVADISGKLIFAKLVDEQYQSEINCPPQLVPQLEALAQSVNDRSSASGTLKIVGTPGNWMLVGTSPILPSSNTGTSRGTWLTASSINGQYIERISRVADVKLDLLEVGDPGVLPDCSAEHANHVDLEPCIQLSNQTYTACMLLVDTRSKPAFYLSISGDSLLYGLDKRYLSLSVLTLSLIALLCATVAMLQLSRTVLSPLSRLSQNVRTIEFSQQNIQLALPAGRDELGQVGQAITSMLSQLNQNYQQLTASESKYRRLVDVAQEGILTADENEVITFANPAICTTLGYTTDQLIGTSLYVLLDEVQHPSILSGSLLRRQGIVSTFEHRLKHRDGGLKEFLVTASPLFNASGMYEGSLGVLTDITEHKARERSLAETQKLESLGVLAGGIAHDFNNILFTIIGNAELLQEELTQAGNQDTKINEIISASQRAAELTTQMLAYSGRGRFMVGQHDLNVLVTEMLPFINAAIPKNVEMKLELAPILQPFKGDATQIRQIILNLLINAAEAMAGEPGMVVVRTGLCQPTQDELTSPYVLETPQPGTYILFEVEDAGCGMDEGTLNKAFDPFFTTKFTGRGLGLSAVLGIIRSHAGTIQVTSRLGEGTLFKIWLPAEATSLEPVAASTKELVASATRSGNGGVLVIDDEPGIRSIARIALTALGYSVYEAGDGQEGLELFEQYHSQIVLVLLDLTMPRLSGQEVYRRLREIHQAIPVILMSGYSADEISSRFSGIQPAGVLAKPFSVRALREAAVKLALPMS